MFHIVTNFESLIAEYFGSPYAVATDSSTHAIELCLRLQNIKKTAVPKHTYPSVPMTLHKIGAEYSWSDIKWTDMYYLEGTNIIDASVLWKEHSYIPGTMMCLSFQFQKHLSLGRGGMILLDDKNSAEHLIKMSYDGRNRTQRWAEQNIETFGYHYYMTPETAELGIKKFHEVKHLDARKWSWEDYPDISKLKVFENVK